MTQKPRKEDLQILSRESLPLDPLEVDTRIPYHGTAASQACLHAPPPFLLPRLPLGSLRSQISFFTHAGIFLRFPPMRSLVPGYTDISCLHLFVFYLLNQVLNVVLRFLSFSVLALIC